MANGNDESDMISIPVDRSRPVVICPPTDSVLCVVPQNLLKLVIKHIRYHGDAPLSNELADQLEQRTDKSL